MTQILFSSREGGKLLKLVWPGLDKWSLVWTRLFEVLAALEQEQSTLGSLRGEIDVDLGTSDRPQVTKWPVSSDPQGIAALRQQLNAAAWVAEPFGLSLPCEPIVVLPDGNLTVIAYDMEDLVDLGDVPLEPVDGDHWRVVGTPRRSSDEPLLSLRFGFDVSRFGNHITMNVCSQYDLWRPDRFDGAPNAVGEANADIMRGCLGRVAASTGGILRPMALQL